MLMKVQNIQDFDLIIYISKLISLKIRDEIKNEAAEKFCISIVLSIRIKVIETAYFQHI